MRTTGMSGRRPLIARSRSRPLRPGILMSETTKSTPSRSSTAIACSAVEAAVTAQPQAVRPETRKRSSDALSSTARTRSGGAEDTVDVVTRMPGARLLAVRHPVEELHPLARQHPVVRKVEASELLGQ